MNSQDFSEWLAALSTSERIRALALIYSNLTVGTRQLFLPDMPKGKEQVVIDMLKGINELHHTLANWLGAYTNDESKAFPVHVLSQQLSEIAGQYQIEGLLTSAVDPVRRRISPSPPESQQSSR